MNPNSLSAHNEQRELPGNRGLAMPVAVPTRSLPAFESSFAGGGDSVSLAPIGTHWSNGAGPLPRSR